jgi:hypothetical protein
VNFPSTVPLTMPVERKLAMPTKVIEFLDGSEQRWCAGDPLNSFSLSFEELVAADVATLLDFFDAVKGQFDATWGFVGPDGVTYPNMALDGDDLQGVESKPGKYAVSMKMKQRAPDGSYAASAPVNYPALANGCYTQRPFTTGHRWLTTRNEMENGAQFAWSEWPAAKRFWTCEYPTLTWAEVQTRIAFFVAARGRLRSFSFADPETGLVASHCRMDRDELTVRALGAGVWSAVLGVVECAA